MNHVPAPVTQPVALAFRDAIVAWYAAHGRELAFRRTADPYAILVSEAMAQQTQAARAAEYWTRFLVEFPTVQALARATPAAVLRAWRGLGYNRRALALRRAAVVIVEEQGGQVPRDLAALRRLPGVGPYTARAVAALAFGQPVGAVDVNVRRVLSRAFGGSLDAFSTAELQEVADSIVPPQAPGAWTHALMDVGATFCRPVAPRCEACPAASACRAAVQGTAEDRSAAGGSMQRRSARAAHVRPAPFESTSRWLRGRLLNLTRDAPGDSWVSVPSAIGAHNVMAIRAAIESMSREGLLERHPEAADKIRLPIR